MTACPAGHDSASDNFCDVCGTRMGGDPASSPGRTIGRHRGPGPGAAYDGQTCPGCGAPVFGQFCDACGFSPRASRPFAPQGWPAESFSSAPAGRAGPPSPSGIPIPPTEAFPPVGSSSGPPESLFPPVSRPEPLLAPGPVGACTVLMEPSRTARPTRRPVRVAGLVAGLPAGLARPTRRARITSGVRGHGPILITILTGPSGPSSGPSGTDIFIPGSRRAVARA